MDSSSRGMASVAPVAHLKTSLEEMADHSLRPEIGDIAQGLDP
jgi:hypothetical protein